MIHPPPADPKSALRSFPSSPLANGTTLYRCHQKKNGLWWFASDPSGRFNLDAPEGTCYFALDRVTAVLEVLRDDLNGIQVHPDAVTTRRVSVINAPAALRLADLGDATAWTFSVTNAIGAADGSVPGTYDLTRAWASGFHAAKFEGVKYATHFSTQANGIAIFGGSGDPTLAAGATLTHFPVDPSPRDLETICGDLGIDVTDSIPKLSSVAIPAHPRFPKRRRLPRVRLRRFR